MKAGAVTSDGTCLPEKGFIVKEYRITIGGIKHTVQLSDDEAKRLGAKAVETKAAPAPQNKARTNAPDKKG